MLSLEALQPAQLVSIVELVLPRRQNAAFSHLPGKHLPLDFLAPTIHHSRTLNGNRQTILQLMPALTEHMRVGLLAGALTQTEFWLNAAIVGG